MNTEYTFEDLDHHDDLLYSDFYRIYTESIALREQKPEAEVRTMVSSPDYKIILVKKSGRAVGFSILFIPSGEGFYLLEYMAIQASYRASGVGGGLFQRSVQAITSKQGNIPMLLEVDSERGDSADRALRMRRKNFYRRHGCLQIAELPYILPLSGQGSPPEMDLMIHTTNSSYPLRKPRLEHWLRVIYWRVYGFTCDDPRIARMMKLVSDPVKLI